MPTCMKNSHSPERNTATAKRANKAGPKMTCVMETPTRSLKHRSLCTATEYEIQAQTIQLPGATSAELDYEAIF